MTNRTIYNIFKRGSRTYFYNSLFFPQDIKEDVFTLYSFVRRADDYVDSLPQRPGHFRRFRRNFLNALEGDQTGDVVADSFAKLSIRKGFDERWHDSFLQAMESDLTKHNYDTLEEVEDYMYGSAEVIGLYMAKIMELPKKAYPHARHLGKSMQFINFIRDIDEDLKLGRTYMPKDVLSRHGLTSLDFEATSIRPGKFRSFIKDIVGICWGWQRTAEKGYRYLPRKYLVPIMNAAEMYKWTAKRIVTDPFVIYKEKVKPSVPRIVLNYGFNALTAAN